MSSSFRRLLPLATLLVSPAFGAEIYQRPVALVRVDTNSNARLSRDPDAQDQTESYALDVADTIGIATPTSETTIKPRVRYQTYPSDHEFDRLEAELSFNSTRSTQRSDFFVSGRFSREDAINAELPSATFTDVIPGTPTNPDTGRFNTGLVRNDFFLVPSYSYKIDPRLSVGAAATGEVTRYSPSDDSSHINFNYYQGRGFVTYALTRKADLSGGILYSKYDAEETEANSNAKGLTSSLRYAWSPLFYTTFGASYQRTNNTANDGITKQKTNNWGVTALAGYKTLLSEIKVDAGRTISPSGAGGLYYVDQIHAQYTRDISERFSMLAAVRVQRNGALTTDNGNDRRYARADLGAEYDLTEHWFINAGYGFTWQKYAFDDGGADNNKLFIGFGYSGLRRQR